ncbi:F-box only protein 6-like [Chanos chanos]|uniref:F-box only protein 6-like n=1 Tax=Chanos chanos TaxID=29144 RepID=A0A6J2USX5_CHACN|nr:F-box only protein 6-like [Chanos chanos]
MTHFSIIWVQVVASPLPLAVVEEIFLNLPAYNVVRDCRLVCREWKQLVDSAALWRERCRREGFEPEATKSPRNWQAFYFLCKNRRNLLKNPIAEDGVHGWKIIQNGGDMWKIEELPEPLHGRIKKYFVTSYQRCLKEQLICLEKEGYSPLLMDEIQPRIIISDWYAPRWDCGSEYEICVELLNHKKQVIQTFRPERVYFPQWNDTQWNNVTHAFQDYGPGVRYVRFIHGGKDTQFWAGWYGIRVTNSSVEINPAARVSADSADQ